MRPREEVRLSKFIILLCVAAVIVMAIIGITSREIWLLVAIGILVIGMLLNIKRIKRGPKYL